MAFRKIGFYRQKDAVLMIRWPVTQSLMEEQGIDMLSSKSFLIPRHSDVLPLWRRHGERACGNR